MLDRYPYARPPYYDDEPPLARERLRFLVLVDGRLVDTWTEPVEGTRWEDHADALDRRTRRDEPPPPPPPHVSALEWLGAACGGPAAVAALHAEELEDDDELERVLEHAERRDRERLVETADLLDGVAAQCFDATVGREVGIALHRALAATWTTDPYVVRAPRTAHHLAAAVAWVVAKANGLLGPQGPVRVGRLHEVLGLSPTASTGRAPVELALRGLRPTVASWQRPASMPDLLLLGRSDLLISSVRARLVRLRAQAEAAQRQASESDDPSSTVDGRITGCPP